MSMGEERGWREYMWRSEWKEGRMGLLYDISSEFARENPPIQNEKENNMLLEFRGGSDW